MTPLEIIRQAQAASLEAFLSELFRMLKPPHRSLVDDVHEDRLAQVWRTNPRVLSYEQCLRSGDPVRSAFARELDDSYGIIDLRRAQPGDGFSWGRYDPNTLVKRFGMHAVFAYHSGLLKDRSSSKPGFRSQVSGFRVCR